MNNQQIHETFSELSTPLIADACLRLKIPLRLAPPGIRPLIIEGHIGGRALPVRHYGSVDIFIEAMGVATLGDILIIDNERRMDEGEKSCPHRQIKADRPDEVDQEENRHMKIEFFGI